MALVESLTINKTVSRPSDAFTAEAEGTMVEQGQGVFENRNGLSCLPSVKLVDVLDEEDDARARAGRLDEDKGGVIYEVEGDPESNIWLSTHFSVDRVALDGLEVSVRATYSRVPEE